MYSVCFHWCLCLLFVRLFFFFFFFFSTYRIAVTCDEKINLLFTKFWRCINKTVHKIKIHIKAVTLNVSRSFKEKV